MRAVTWQGTRDMSVESVPDPEIVQQSDVVVKVSATAICGSDLHLYNLYITTMQKGDILGHEFMGEVVEVGRDVKKLKKGDRVVVPFPISCGRCWYCKQGLFGACDNSNPNAELVEGLYGATAGAAIFGYSHLYGGYSGGQAEYARVPFADVGPIKIPDGVSDEQVLFLSDILPTGWQAAKRGEIKEGDTVAVWGCGPVGYFAIQSAYVQGAARVIAIDRFPERLALARDVGKAEVIDYEQTDDLVELLKQMTGGKGPDVCIDAVGLEAHGHGFLARSDRVKQALRLEMDRPTVIRQSIQAAAKGGRVSIIGVYGGLMDKFPIGAFFGKGLKMAAGQCDVQQFLPELLERVLKGEFDMTSLISHRVSLEDAPDAYRIFCDKKDGCTKVVMRP
ncbi:MAG: glutathione-dependent formaldehyde dehydrogenase [Gemmatimonadota bacterium]|nr:glutathione-dependent formaldehyde dehydrogenase [Gemmatimonadota bacterium]